ncbi:MAG: hypothetical protein KUG77_23420 [Nannocystaceae bacterium]|nr:hypothetical protein [Nannocystaceae bacterium]
MHFSKGGGELVAIRKVVLCDDDPDIRAIGEISLRDVGGWLSLIHI